MAFCHNNTITFVSEQLAVIDILSWLEALTYTSRNYS